MPFSKLENFRYVFKLFWQGLCFEMTKFLYALAWEGWTKKHALLQFDGNEDTMFKKYTTLEVIVGYF